MPFPDAGDSIPSTGTGNIRFSDLRLSYLSNGSSGGNEGLNNKEGVLNLSFFRGVSFTSGDPVPGEGAISIGTDFCGKTFAPAEGGGEGEPEPGGSANVRVSLIDSFGDGWDDDGDGDETTHNRLIITDSGGSEVFNNTNTDDDELTEQSETHTFDITLSPGNYSVEVTLAPGQESFGDFAFDMSYSITLISDNSVLDSYDFSIEENVPESGSHSSGFSIS